MNTYSFLLFFCGIISILIPLYKISLWFLIPQIIACLIFFKQAFKLFSSWKDKKIKYQILMGKNKNEFRADSFEVFMKAPCGRLLTKAVLKDLHKEEEYKNLLVYKEPFVISLRNSCKKQVTTVYINEDFK